MAAVELSKLGAPGANGLSLLSDLRDPYASEGRIGELWFNYATVVFFKKFMVGGWKPILRLQGRVGPPGRSGVSVLSVAVNEAGRLIITMSDGQVFDAGYVVGAPGASGDGSGDMIRSLNLSDVVNKDIGLTNLGATPVGKAVFRAISQDAGRFAIDALGNHARLTAFRDMAAVAGTVPFFTDGSTFSGVTSTAFGRSLLALADQPAGEALLGGGKWTRLAPWAYAGSAVAFLTFVLPPEASEFAWVGEGLSHGNLSAQFLEYAVSYDNGTTWSSYAPVGNAATILPSEIMQTHGHLYTPTGPSAGPPALMVSGTVLGGQSADSMARMRRLSQMNQRVTRIRFSWSSGSFDGGEFNAAWR